MATADKDSLAPAVQSWMAMATCLAKWCAVGSHGCRKCKAIAEGHAWPCRQSIREALPSGEHTPGPPDEVAAKAGLCRMYGFAQRQEAKEGGVQHVPSM